MNLLEATNMEIKLTHEESEEYFLNALCNGLSEMNAHGFELDWRIADADKARTTLKNPTYEDVLMQILRDGGKLTMVDEEYDGDYTKSIRLADVHERVKQTPSYWLIQMAEGNDDAYTADAILQTVFFKEIIFG
jgi:hypothetical protein